MQLHKLFRLPQMFSDSDRRRGREDGKRDERQGLFLEALGGDVCREAGRCMGNERGQLAGSGEGNS